MHPSPLHEDGIVCNDFPSLYSACSTFISEVNSLPLICYYLIYLHMKVLSPLARDCFPELIGSSESLHAEDFFAFVVSYNSNNLVENGMDWHFDECLLSFSIEEETKG